MKGNLILTELPLVQSKAERGQEDYITPDFLVREHLFALEKPAFEILVFNWWQTQMRNVAVWHKITCSGYELGIEHNFSIRMIHQQSSLTITKLQSAQNIY